MSRHPPRSALQYILQGAASALLAIAGIYFFFDGRAIHDFGGVDRTLAEIVGIGGAFLCLIIAVAGKYKIDDIDWREQNEEAENHQEAIENKANEPRA
jgi:uncharacterized membrane protein